MDHYGSSFVGGGGGAVLEGFEREREEEVQYQLS